MQLGIIVKFAQDERVGPEAKKLFEEAKEMLDWIVKEGHLKCTGAPALP